MADKVKRVSGVWPADTREGKVAFARMTFPARTGDFVHPDYNAMREAIGAYLERNGIVHNPAGYRAALGNINYRHLNLWLHGYVSDADADSEDIEPNPELIAVMEWGRNGLIDNLYNQDSKYQSQLVIRTLEGMGELTPQKKIVDVNLSGLGTWEQWSK